MKTTIRSQLLGLAALVALPLVLAYAYSTYQRIERESVLANEKALGLAKGLAQDVERLIGSSGELVKALAARPQIRAFDPARCDPLLLAGMHEVLPRFANIALVSLEGKIVCASRAPSVNSRPVNAEPWFQEAITSRAMAVSKPFKGVITGRPVVTLAHPILAADGRPLGVIVMPVDLLGFKPILAALADASKVSLGAVHRDGTLVWRSRETAIWIGRNVADRDVMKRMLAQGGGLVNGLGFDGSDRIYAGAPVSGTQWLAYAGIPKSEAHAALVADAWRTLLVGLAGLLAAMFVAWRMARTMAAPVQALGEAARIAAGGNYAVRVAAAGPLEVTEAATQLNRMLAERHQQEQRVLLSEERFRALAEMSADWFWEQDAELRFISTDAYDDTSPQRMTPERQTLGKHRWDMPIVSMSEADWAAHRAVLARREPFRDLVYQGYNSDGELRWSLINGNPVFDADGTFTGYRGAGRDITAAKEAERRLREERERYRTLVELTSDWYWRQDEHYRFTYREGMVLAQMGLPVEQDYGKTRWDMDFLNMSEDDWMQHRALLDRREEFRDLLLARRAPDGRVFWATISGRPLFDEGGLFIGYQGTGRDVTAQIVAQHALAQQEAQLQLVLDNVPAMIAYFDEQRICRFGNRPYAVFHGVDPDQLVGRDENSFLSQDGRQASDLHYPQVRAGQSVRYQVSREHPQFGRVIMDITRVPHMTPNGSFSGSFVLLHDVSDLVHTQEVLRESESRFRAIFEGSPLPMTLVDEADATIHDVNQAWLERYGYAREEALGKTSIGLGLWAEPDGRERMMEELEKRGQVDAQLVHDRMKDGAIRLAEFHVRRLHTDHKRWLLSMVNDITDLMRSQDDLRESEQRFRAIFEACPVPMSLTRERDGVRIDVNPAWQSVMGYARSEVVGAGMARINTYVNPADREHLLELLHEAGEVNAFEFPARRKDSTILTAQAWIRRLVIGGENCLLLITRDVTQERESERQIRELNETLEQRVVERTNELAGANQELEAFAYSVSHDLRAPLRGIDGYSQVLLESHGALLDEDGRRSLDRIRRGTQRMGQLIDDLLNLAKVTRAPLKRSTVDISALAAEVSDELARSAPERKVEWQIEPGITVMADPGLMRVILDNLIGNAWKYSRNNPAARIIIEAAQARQAGFEFAVHDNGAGFDMAYVERLFRPFQRLHTASQFEGTGIGLATVQRILVRHGGRIEAGSMPGVETVFRVATQSVPLH